MNITLFALNSSYTHTNLAVRHLASSLDGAGFDCSIKEFVLKDKRSSVLHELVSQKSDIYGFSAYIWNIEDMLDIACNLKKLSPQCHIIFGGPEVSFENKEFLNDHPYIDTLIRGEGESVIAKICADPDNYTGEIVDGECTDLFINDGILYDRYPSKGDILYYESTRGCPHRCSYCLSSLSKGIRAKSAEQTLAELRSFEHLPQKPRIIKFIDRTFNYDLERAKRIWEALQSDEYSLNYHFEITADKLDEESFNILSKIPKGKIQFEAGIQSTNPRTLEAVNRKCDVQKIIHNLKRIKDQGNIHIHADLIVGLPYEDADSFEHSFNSTINCCHKLQVGFLKMLRGSSIRANKEMHGYIYEDKPPYTVLCNSYMSYDEIYRLSQISDTIDRYYSADNFRNTMDYIVENCSSPFRFFSRLSEMSENNSKALSQHECRMILFSLIKEEFDSCEVLERLALDTLLYENKNPPEELRNYYNEISISDTKIIINANAEKFKSYSRNNWQINTFSFDAENYYAMNRTKHILIKLRRCIK